MHRNDNENPSNVLDAAQLVRIEAVHRGFLYQHLYAVGCLLLAQAADVDAVMVELDEDIELIPKQGRIYVQVKTRSKPIIPSDISGAIGRFEDLRKEHADGKRKGEASFMIVANQAPSSQLQQTIDLNKLPLMFFSFGPSRLQNATRHYHPLGSLLLMLQHGVSTRRKSSISHCCLQTL